MPIMEYITTITKTDDSYRVRIERPGFDPLEVPAALDRESKLTIKGTELTLETVWDKLIAFAQDDLDKLFDERGQMDIGLYLFKQMFGSLGESEMTRLRQEDVDLRIVTDDEWIALLPWTLLYNDAKFLAATGWRVSISKRLAECTEVRFPTSPKIMVVMPEPRTGFSPTDSEAHFTDLEKALSRINPLNVIGKKLHRVDNWQDFADQVPKICPDILYFYGHGYSDRNTSEVVFTYKNTNEPASGEPEFISASLIGNLLEELGPRAPYLAYFNCCDGEVGGVLGIGKQLSRVVPAVITNCTKADAEAARSQALEIFLNVLERGLAPHHAVAALRENDGMRAGFLGDVRWLTPVVRCGYSAWTYIPPKVSKAKLPLGWDLTLNRITPTSVAMRRTRGIIEARPMDPRVLVLVWYATKSQGVDPFYRRLELELKNEYEKDTGILIKEPEPPLYSHDESDPRWPMDFDESASEMMIQAFDVATYDEIGNQVESELREIGKQRALVYIRFPVINNLTDFYKTSRVKNFVDWLNTRFADRFNERTYLVIGLGYEVKDPDKFREALTECFQRIQYDGLAFHSLGELPPIQPDDLDEFFRSHEDCVYLPHAERWQAIDTIMERSGGVYEKAVEELKDFVYKNVRNTAPNGNEAVDY